MKTTRKLRWLSLVLTVATLMAHLLVACTEGGNENTTPADSATVTAPATDVLTREPDTAAEPPTEEVTTEEVTTEAPATRVNEPTDPAHTTFFDSKRPRLSSVLNGAHQCKFKIVMDGTYGSVLKLTTTSGASDPFVYFDYGAYMKGLKLDAVNADEYKYLVFTIRPENCSSETFELFYCAGTIAGATPAIRQPPPSMRAVRVGRRLSSTFLVPTGRVTSTASAWIFSPLQAARASLCTFILLTFTKPPRRLMAT